MEPCVTVDGHLLAKSLQGRRYSYNMSYQINARIQREVQW